MSRRAYPGLTIFVCSAARLSAYVIFSKAPQNGGKLRHREKQTGLRESGKSKSIKKTLSDQSDARMDGR
jgi:hypothetical protein